MGPTALLPLRRKACWGFFRPKNPTVSAGCEPANLCTKGQHATSRPPRPLHLQLGPKLSYSNDISAVCPVCTVTAWTAVSLSSQLVGTAGRLAGWLFRTSQTFVTNRRHFNTAQFCSMQIVQSVQQCSAPHICTLCVIVLLYCQRRWRVGYTLWPPYSPLPLSPHERDKVLPGARSIPLQSDKLNLT